MITIQSPLEALTIYLDLPWISKDKGKKDGGFGTEYSSLSEWFSPILTKVRLSSLSIDGFHKIGNCRRNKLVQ